MLDEGNNLNLDAPEPQPEETGNRTFLIVGGIFAALIFLTLICMAVYFLVIAPRLAGTQAAQDATAEAQRLEQAQAMTETAEAALFTETPLPSAIPTSTRTKTLSPAASPTLVVVLASPTEGPTSDPATLAAAQTQLAGQMTQTSAAGAGAGAGAGATAAGAGQVTRAVGGDGPLPNTGFFNDVGLPLLLVLTLALLVVIFIARRMRKAPTK
jgi:type II secretory pathway pseudopilin PulG